MSVYNEEKYIEEAFKSILNQTLNDFEIIIVNDCSTDSTLNILQRIQKNLEPEIMTIIDNDVNQGITANLNKALPLAKGKYIARMDGDDISDPKRFEVQIKYLEEHPDLMLISCNTNTFGELNLVSDIAGTPEELRCKMLLRPQLAHPGFMMRRELVTELGFSYDEHFKSAQDYDFAARVTRKEKIGVTPEVLLSYRSHKGQISQTPSLKQFGFADEIRERLLGELGITFNEKELDAYHHWVLESKADKEVCLLNKKTLNNILKANKEKAHIYDEKTLEKTLWSQYFTWLLRAKVGTGILINMCGVNPALYSSLFITGVKLIISKRRRSQR